MPTSYFHKIFSGFLDTSALEDKTYTMFRKVGYNIPSFAAPHPRRKETSIFVGIFSPLRLDYGRSPHVPVNQRLQIKFKAPDEKGCAAQ
jgi:hypothetical protein